MLQLPGAALWIPFASPGPTFGFSATGWRKVHTPPKDFFKVITILLLVPAELLCISAVSAFSSTHSAISLAIFQV